MKRLSFRFVRRLMLLLALVFPVVYLMGGFVAALAGSHGNVTLAQDDDVVTSSNIVDFNQYVRNGDFSDGFDYWSKQVSVSVSASSPSVVVTSVESSASTYRYQISCDMVYTAGHSYVFFFDWSSSAVTEITFTAGNTNLRGYFNSSPVSYSFVSPIDSVSYISLRPSSAVDAGGAWTFSNIFIVDLTQMYGAGNEPTADVFRARYNAAYYNYTLSTKLVEETTGTPTYSEYLFNQILGSDNIIKQWGYYALSDEDKGFAPFASLIQIVDDNFFHLGDSNDLGLFVYGYVYYALNIVAIYELVALVVMVFTIPLKLTDRFNKEM